MNIYLASTKYDFDWRKYLIDRTRVLFNGKEMETTEMVFISPVLENEFHPDTVLTDKKLISECDLFIAYIDRYTAGTLMELLYAWSLGKPTYVVSTTGLLEDLWISYHAICKFKSLDECANAIILRTKTYKTTTVHRKNIGKKIDEN